MNGEKKFEVVKFIEGEFALDVKVSPKEDAVWLTARELAILFNVSIDNINWHIKNIFMDGELDYSVAEESSVTAPDGKKYITKIYNLDMIISVGYRVNSKRGTGFFRIISTYYFCSNGLSFGHTWVHPARASSGG